MDQKDILVAIKAMDRLYHQDAVDENVHAKYMQLKLLWIKFKDLIPYEIYKKIINNVSNELDYTINYINSRILKMDVEGAPFSTVVKVIDQIYQEYLKYKDDIHNSLESYDTLRDNVYKVIDEYKIQSGVVKKAFSDRLGKSLKENKQEVSRIISYLGHRDNTHQSRRKYRTNSMVDWFREIIKIYEDFKSINLWYSPNENK